MNAYNKRQELIISYLLRYELGTGELLELLAEQSIKVSEDTLVRDINGLKDGGLIESLGKGPARKHCLTTTGRLRAPLSQDSLNLFLTIQREPVRYNREWLASLVSTSLFSDKEQAELEVLQKKFRAFIASASEAVKDRWYQKWLIEFAWKSSAIEGNTYDALETETLLLDHIEATGKTHSEAVMILNHQSAIKFVYGQQVRFGKPNRQLLEEIHRLLVHGLNVASGIRDVGVGISGSAYRPLATQKQITEEVEKAMAAIASQDIWSCALRAILAISYLQPFEDGNKRTARVLANGFLYANQSIPLVLGAIEPTRYRRACLAFYEFGNTSLMKEIMIESWSRTVEELA